MTDARSLVLDLETTGLPKMRGFNQFFAPHRTSYYDSGRIVQIAWQILSVDGDVLHRRSLYVKPSGTFCMNPVAQSIHKITTQHLQNHGGALEEALELLTGDLKNVTCFVGHNVAFDFHVLLSEISRAGPSWQDLALAIFSLKQVCTMQVSTQYCQLLRADGAPKWPKLSELFQILFPDEYMFVNAHDAAADVAATVRCYNELVRLGVVKLSEE